MYVYYAVVYSAIQDVIEPALRGTAMALYFFAMYVLGASFGTWAIGLASDYYTRGGRGRGRRRPRTTRRRWSPSARPACRRRCSCCRCWASCWRSWCGPRRARSARDMDRLQEWMRTEAA